jgi:DNA topoisomerase-1
MMPGAADWHDGQSRVCRGFNSEHARYHRQPFPKVPAISRKSYFHDTIVTAFEDGIPERFAATMKGYRSQSKREQLLAQVVMAAAA